MSISRRQSSSCVVGSFAATACVLLFYLSAGDIGGFSISDDTAAALQHRDSSGHRDAVAGQNVNGGAQTISENSNSNFLKETSNPVHVRDGSELPQLLPSASAACIRRLHENVGNWLTCVDPTVPAAAGSTKWLKNNVCNFTDVTSFDSSLVSHLFLTNLIEAHGDSTLREVVKLMIGGLRMDGTLDKRDASSTLRYPKYFTRLWSNCSLTDLATMREDKAIAAASNVAVSNLVSGGDAATVLPTETAAHLAASRIARRTDCYAKWCPAAFRVMFRFDFVPSSFGDPLADSVPMLPVAVGSDASSSICSSTRKKKSGVSPSTTTEGNRQRLYSFFDGIPSHRILLLATGSHTAKLLLMNQSTHAYAKKLTQRSSFSEDELFKLIVADVEAYVIRRILGLVVLRDNSVVSLRGEERRTSFPNEEDATHQPIDYVVMMQETLECESMAEAKLSGFRDMSVHCAPMKVLVHRINEELERHFSTFRRLSGRGNVPNEPDGRWHKNSALRALNTEQRSIVLQRVFVVPYLACHDGRFQYTPSKPFCTRDGIHLRTKFIRQKVNLLLNLIGAIDNCEN